MSTVQIAEVQEIQGTAYAVNADGERRLLQAGDALFDGESVETSEGGVVELILSDGQSFVIAGQPVFLISADLIADLAPGADESVLQAETLDELLAEGSLESLEQIIESADEAEAESLDDLLTAAEEDPSASGIDFDNLAATAAGGDDSGADGGGSTIVQATRISSSGDDTSATLTEGNTQAAPNTDAAGGNNNSISVAFDDAFAISEDTPSAGNLADNDALSGDVTFALLDQAGPSNGAVTLNEDGTFVFTPNTDFVGGDSFQYVITDANGQTSTATVSITVEAVNDVPVAVDDVVLAQEDVRLENINVLDNDSDSDGNLLTVTSAVSAAGGVVTINPDGTLSYQAPANFTGADTINYTIDDGAGGSSTAVVNIDVAPVSDLAAADDQNAGAEDAVILGSVADNDTTGSGGALTYAVESDVENGALTFNTDGSYEYTPNPNFNGTDSFTYVVTDADSGEGLTQLVTLTIDPVSDLTAADDQNAGDQDTVISGSVAGNDTTRSGGSLIYAIESGTESGALIFNADGAYDYTPSSGFTGTDSFSYVVTDADSGESVTQTVTLTVNALDIPPVDEPPVDETPIDEPPVVVNQAPIAQDDDAAVVQNVPLSNIKVLDNDEDPEGEALTVTAAVSASGALVSINADGTLNYTPNVDFLGADTVTYTIIDPDGATAQASLIVVVAEPQAQNALEGEPLDVYLEDTEFLRSLPADTTVTVASSQGSIVSISEDGVMSYQAPDGFTGEDVITYTIDDGQGNVVTKTVVVQVYPQNAPLVGIDDSVVTPEDVSLSNIAVLANDKIEEGSEVAVVSATSSFGAQVEINADGTLNYTPKQDFTGIDTVTYTARNGDGIESTATLSVEVTPENDPPVAVVDSVTTLEDTPLENINVLGNDIDVEGDTLTVLEVSSAEGAQVSVNDDGTVNYQPNANFNGVDTITYSVSDGVGGVTTGELKISVEAVNDAPVVTSEQVSVVQNQSLDAIAVLLNDEDPDGNPLSVEAVVASDGGTVEINEDGTLKYTPAQDYVGQETLTYTVIDGQGGRVEGQVTVSVSLSDDGPVANEDSVSVDEDGQLLGLDVLGNDRVADGETLSVVSATSEQGATVVINDDGTLDYEAPANFDGIDVVTYTARDSQGRESQSTVTVTVNEVNDAPVASDDTATALQSALLENINVLANDTDVENDALTVIEAVSANGATVVINADGTLNYQSADGFSGLDTVSYTISDGAGGTSGATLSVTVELGAILPVAVNDGVGAVEDTLLKNINVLDNDTDANNDTLTVTSAVSTAGGAVTINADGTLNYLPPANFTGEDTITYSISDGNEGASTATVTVSVASINDTPVAFSANEDTSEETVLNGAVPGATDLDGTIVSYTVVNDVAEGLLTLEVDGSYRFDPSSDFDDLADGESRDVTFTYTATDNEDQASAPATITITVTGTNDVPVANAATQNTDENTVLEATVAATSVDGVIASYAVASDLADEGQGSLTFNADGSYSFEPGDDFDDLADGESREVAFTYTATDNSGGVSAPATVTITVTGTNDTPVAIGASVETLEDTSIIELDVLGNVTDIDGDTITLVSVDSEAGGTITLNEGGTINYVPAENYFGSDTLTYVATDPAGGSVTGSIAIDIIAVNDVPVVVGETIVTEEDAAVDNIVVLANDSDIEGDALSVTAASSVNGGTVTINPDGTLNYSPPANFNGTDTIEYTVTDAGGAASVGAVLVTVNPVNDQPIASTLGATTGKGIALEGDLSLSVEAGDAPLTFGLMPGAEPQHGVVTLNDDGTFVYTPDEDFSGIERFGYTVTDEDGDQSFSVVTISVVADSFRANAESDLPDDVPVAASDVYAVDEDMPITGRVTQNDDLSTDGDGTNVVTVAESDGPSHGALTMSEAGVFVYTPDTNYFGADSFRYTLTDANGDTSSAVVTLNVGQVNDEAVFEGDVSGTMLEDGGLDRPLGEGAEVTPIIGALSATDFLGGVLEDTGLAGIDNLGTENGFRIAVDDQYVQAQGGVATIDADGNWAYTPNANFNGPDSFTVLVTDDLGNVESQVINVTVDVQTDLSAADDAISVDEDDVLNASVADNDSTISGGALTYALAAGATVGNGELLFNEDGSYTYTPNTDYYGPDSFSYVVTDAASGESSTQAVSITVNPVVEANAITIDRIEGDSGVAGDFQTNDTTLTVSGSLEKAIASDERVEISTDGGETWTTVTVDGTNWSFEDPTEQDASFTFVVRIAGPGDSVGATAEQAVTIDTTPPIAIIELDSAITSDNVINAQESNSDVTVSGSVGGEARVGDTVTLTVNGVQSQAAVESIEGALRFSVNIPGADLVADGDLAIDAAITTTDDAGNISEVATDVQTYAVDLEAFATITVEVLPELEGVALENAIAVAAYRGDDLNVTGVAGLDAADAGEITLTVNGNTYTGTVGEQGTYSIAIAAADLVDAESAAGTTRAISVTVEASDEAGNPATASAATDVLVRPVQQVQFTDNYVDGVSYSTTSGLSGTTGTNESTGEAGAQGSFLYRAGDTITLTLGSVIIAEFSADQVQGDVLFLQDIAGVALSDVNNDYVENMAIFLQTLDADASADNGIQITPETAAFFEGYTDSGTGEALNIATAGKQLLANALTAAANAVDDQGNSLNLLPADFEFSADSETDQDGANDEGLLENTFESVALQHVADTIDVLGADRQTDLFAFDDRQSDTIDAGTGIIEYAYVTDGNTVSAMNFSAYAISERTGQPVGLLANATPQQVSLDNMVVENVQVGPEYAGIVESVVYDDVTKEGTITLVEGVTPEQLEGLYLTYRVKDWTAVTETTATAIDTYRSHLSSDAGNVSEDAQYNQFTLTSALTFDTDQALTVKISPESFGDNFAEYADDFLVPMEYSTDGGATWQVMDQVGTYTRDGYDLPLPLFGFTLPAGQDTLEVRISVFDDQTIETDEVIDLLIEGENFYPERVQPGILDNETQATLPIVDIDYAVVSEGDGVAVLTVTLSEAADGDVTVDYTTGDLGATAGEDYQAISGTITIPEGQTSFQVEVSLIDDTVEEDTEFLVVNLSNVSANAVLADPQATVRILDNENNTAPTVEAVQADGEEDPSSPIEVTLTGSDNDPYDKVTSFTLSSLPENGVLYANAAMTTLAVVGQAYQAGENESLTFFFAPNENWNGETTFDYKGSDGELESTETVATVTVTGTNDAPVAVADTLDAVEDTPVTYTAAELVGNDTDIENSALTISSVTSGSNGTAVLNQNGTVTFTPNENYNGAADFTYIVNDGTTDSTSSATVTVNVAAVQDAATFGGATSATTDEDTATGGTLTVADTADGITPTDFTVASDGSNGTATIDASTGAWTYTPNANFNGTDSFTVTVTDDDGNTETQVIEVTVGQVQDAATFGGATSATTDEDTATGGTLTVADTADGITPTDFTVASDGSNGTATIDASTGAWTYTPNANFNGTDSFTVTVTDDDGNTETQVIEVTVGQVQDAATFGGATSATTDEDTATGGTLTVADTADGITPTDFTVASDGSNGTATIDASTGAWTYTPNANFNGTDSFTVTVTDDDGNTETQVIEVTVGQVQDAATFGGATSATTDEDTATGGTLTVADTADGITPTDFTVASDGSNGTATIDASTGAWTYTPNANFNGTDSFTVTVTDDDGNTETQVIEVTVGQVQDAATFGGATSATTDEDTATGGTLTVADTADGITPTDFTVASDGSNGTATIDASTGAWTYTPNANFNGTDSFTVTVTDDDGNTETQVIEVTVGQVQDAATFGGATSATTDEDTATGGTLTVADTADGITPTDFTVASDGSNGTATIDASTGAWTYTPNANFNGTDSFTVTVTDDDGNTETQVIEVTVGQVQDAATFGGATSATTDEDTATGGTLTVADTADGITPTDFTVASDGSNGTATIDASTGAWTYTPNANFNGTDSFTVTVTDDDGNTETQVIEVTVGQVQDAATFGGATSATTDEDTATGGTLTVADTADGITPTDFTVASDGSNGTATIDASTGAWTYTPNANFNGTDSFTVTVTDDDGNTETQVIEVTVGQVQDAATFGGATSATTDEDTATGGTLTVADTADGITPTDFTVASDGSNGTATIDASTGAWTYTPNANFNGTDSFTVTVTDDDGNTETQVIEVTVGQVQDAATFGGATSATTDEDTATGGTLTVADTADGITPTDFTVASDGSNGTATIDASTGAWTYTPNANFNGTDSFTVTVTDDDGNTETQVIEVTVGQVQDAATFGGATSATTDEDTATGGTLTVADTADGITPTDFTVASDGSNGTATIDASTGAWTYTPNANFNGTDSFTVTVTDDDGNTETQVIEVTVGQVQDAATFGGATSATTDEDTATGGTLTVADTADGITPTDFTVASDGSNGTATIDASTGAWTYTPNANFNGTDSFTVTVTDDDGNTETQVIEVTVGQVQDAATFGGATSATTDEDTATGGTLTVADTADGITPTDFTVASDGSNGTATIDASTGAWTYTPNANFNGTDSFTVTVTDDDGNTETQVIEVTVGQVQDAATFGGATSATTDEDTATGGTLTVADTADGITPTDFTVASDGSNGTATIDASTGAWTYTPNANFNGTDSFTVTVTDDDGNTETQVIEVTVGQVQDAATFGGATSATTDEDTATGGTLTVADTADGITPTDFTVASDGSNGTATIDASTGAWTYTPNANFNGTDSFTVTVTDDDGNTETQVIEVTVGQVQDAATFGGATSATTDEDTATGGTLTVADTADGITPTDFTVASDGSNGTATIDASTGAWTYTPNANFNGTDSFTVTVTDDDGNTETQVIEVTVGQVQDAATFGGATSATTDEDTATGGTLTVADTADGITPTDFTVASDGSNGTATIDASTGAWTYTPNANFNGTDSFTVTVTDDDGNTETQVIEVTVGQVQDAATFGGATSATTDEDTATGGTLTVADTADGITPTDFTVASDGSNGTATIDASTGAWTYTPNANFNGTDSFTVTVTDDDGNTETQVIEVTVGQVQDAATFGGATSATTDEDTATGGTLTVADTADGITPTDFTVASDGSNGTATIDASTGAWTYTPNANFNGTDSFTVTVTDDDGNTETQVIEVTVGQVQDAATFGGATSATTDEDTATGGTLTVADTADGITPTDFTVASDGSNGTATIDASTGAWTYTPNANFNGTDSFTVTVTDDDGNTETQVIEVTVGQVQDAATFGGATSATTDEDTATGGTLTVADTADGITPTDFTVASDGSNGTATIDASTGAWTYTPNANFNGTDSFTVTVTDDDGNTETQVIEVTVGQVQDAATFGGATSATTDEDTATGGTLTVADTADGITPTDFTVASDGSNGTATIDASTGAWTYTPNANFNGTDSFTVTVTDDDGNTETQVIEVTVGQVQDAATFGGATSATTDEDTATGGTLTVADTADGITPTDFTVASDGSNGTATIDASTGAWTYTPNANFNGTDSFTVTVTDDDGNTETQVIEVTVEATDSVTPQSIVIDGSEINAVPSSTVVVGRNDADDDDDVIIDNLIGPDIVITDESGQHVKFKNGVVGTKGDGDLLKDGDSLRFSYYDDVDLSLTSNGKFANYSADSSSLTNNAQVELSVDGASSARASLSVTALAADGTTIAVDSVQVTYADGSSEVLTVADANFSSNGSGVVTITDLPDGVSLAVHGVSNYASLDFENESSTKFGFLYGTDAEDAKASDGSDDAVYAPDVGIGYVISTDGHKVKVKNGLIGVKDTGNIKDETIDPGENLTIDFQTGIETDRGDDGKLDSYTAGTDVEINHASFRLLAEGLTDITINLTDSNGAAVSVAYVLVTHDGTTYRLTSSNGAANPVVIDGQNVTFSESSDVVTLNNLPDDVTVQVAGDSDYSAIDLSNAGAGTNQFAIADIDSGSDSFASTSGQFATLATGSFSDWSKTGAVTSSAGEALTVNGEALSYVSAGEKLLAVTSSGIVAFAVSLQEVNGVTGYSVEMYRSLDPSFTDISSSNSVSPSNSASKTINFSNSSLQITITATTNGQATTINGQQNPAKYGPGNDKEVNTNDALIFTASSSISGLDLSLFDFSGTDTLVWTAYDGATVVASGTVVPSDLSNSNLEIDAGVPFTSVSITAGSGDFQIVDDGIVAQEVNETPSTLDLQTTVNGNSVDFSITFDQLSAGDTTMAAVDPDSLLLAGAGSETLIGLAGEADTFEWNLADGMSSGDTIQGFEEGSDVIDLSDLLTGYDPADPNNDDLADFIQVAYDSATGDTTIEVSSNGDGTIDQVIKVEGVDLTDDVSLTGLSGNDSINAILSDMMTKGTLIDPDI